MKANTLIAVVLVCGGALWAQSPQVVSNTRQKLQSAQKTWNSQQDVVDSPASGNSPLPVASKETSNGTASNKAETRSSGSEETQLPEDSAGSQRGEDRLTAAARRNATKRDPFISPIVSRLNGPGAGCSGGKRCLAVDSVSLRGIVKSENGMIAVVVNAANKAYFLRENDPVFNGYVVRITGDSVVFKETVQDALGRPFTHDVVKKLFVPAV
ncbi:MAG TPA: hypothetical protein VFA76_16175 [Terriglobales bacterium]|nr:hypothetical protein [Terriglobales bacterium]